MRNCRTSTYPEFLFKQQMSVQIVIALQSIDINVSQQARAENLLEKHCAVTASEHHVTLADCRFQNFVKSHTFMGK